MAEIRVYLNAGNISAYIFFPFYLMQPLTWFVQLKVFIISWFNAVVVNPILTLHRILCRAITLSSSYTKEILETFLIRIYICTLNKYIRLPSFICAKLIKYPAEKLVHTFIMFRLDYSIALKVSSKPSVDPVARVLTGIEKESKFLHNIGFSSLALC